MKIYVYQKKKNYERFTGINLFINWNCTNCEKWWFILITISCNFIILQYLLTLNNLLCTNCEKWWFTLITISCNFIILILNNLLCTNCEKWWFTLITISCNFIILQCLLILNNFSQYEDSIYSYDLILIQQINETSVANCDCLIKETIVIDTYDWNEG